ncbi:MAG: RluA family pseudouridine synthase [Clostridia bacterium]|nr:RluA family pseudouridine synthase [Clostridia bacterium]
MEIFVDESRAGKTVLDVLRRELGFSSKLIKHLKFMERGILVGDAHVTVRYVLSAGEILSLAIEDEVSGEKLLPVDLPLTVAYEDEDVVVPAKPYDMPTHPSFGHYEDTVANALAFRYAELGVPFVFRPVNRLDRNTSGLLLIARNRRAAGTLFASMKRGEIGKLYLAILDGELCDDGGLIETYMRRTAESVILRENCGPDEGGDPARTRYRVLARGGGMTLVCAVPLTGRTHQLRVHFAGLGAPLVGDDMYGRPSELISRHALHSCALSFFTPSTKERVFVVAPLPDDMRVLLDKHFSGVSQQLTEKLFREMMFELGHRGKE